MAFVLIQFCDTWADEFRIHGVRILNPIAHKKWRSKLEEKHFPSREIHFGTNQWFRYNTLEEYDACLTTTQITKNQALFLVAMFGSKWGNFIDPVEYD